MNIILRILRPICMVFVGIYFRLTKKCKVSIWALLNRNTVLEGYNMIYPKAWISNSKIGYSSIISSYCILDHCIVGRYCSIGENVKVISDSHPTHTFVSTHPAFYSTNKQSGYSYVYRTVFDEQQYYDKKNSIRVKIGNDVWIGNNVTIMGGLVIGDGAIIATGAVVTKNVLPYSIAGGVPAKVIRKRFTDSQVDFLLDFKWWDKPVEWIRENANFFQDIEVFVMNQKRMR